MLWVGCVCIVILFVRLRLLFGVIFTPNSLNLVEFVTVLVTPLGTPAFKRILIPQVIVVAPTLFTHPEGDGVGVTVQDTAFLIHSRPQELPSITSILIVSILTLDIFLNLTFSKYLSGVVSPR